MKIKEIKNKLKKLFTLEFYQDMLVSFLRPIFFTVRHPRKALRWILKTWFSYHSGSTAKALAVEPLCLKMNSKKLKKASLILVFVVLIVVASFIFYHKKSAEASWWNDDWFYRKAITINNSSGGTLTDFQVKILNNYDLSGDVSNGKIQPDLDDLRFNNSSGQSLDYWIEDNTASSVDIWVKISSLPISGITVYMYYGNSQASAYSDGNKVFDFFDDFNIFDETKWAATGAKSLANGKMAVTTGAVYSKNTIATTPQNKTIEIKARYLNGPNTYSGICIAETQSTGPSNNGASALAYNMTNHGTLDISASGSDGVSSGYNMGTVYLYSHAVNIDYIMGYTFQGSSNIKYFIKDLAYADLGATTLSGTWNYPFYFWMGFYTGSASGTQNIDDLEIDWARVRKYASTEPTVGTIGAEEKGPSPNIISSF